ncbi:ORF V: Enzymatic polyprotein [Labeo rohita]|uniref:ORF V: Enzymatic polyprotein n=1 Tax=Labeo rohita TaxID=84645 RepID=A0ABQ8M137_LABRO|nr:ORF V: Enzymatic polyprotein [Labeo rohita]
MDNIRNLHGKQRRENDEINQLNQGKSTHGEIAADRIVVQPQLETRNKCGIVPAHPVGKLPSTLLQTSQPVLSLCHLVLVQCSVTLAKGFSTQPVGLGKEQTLPNAGDLFSWYGVGFGQTDSTPHGGMLMLNCLIMFKSRAQVPLKQLLRLLGHMTAAVAVTPLGLLHMRQLQHWIHGRVPRPCFLWAGGPLEQVSRHAVVYTDASITGWGATYGGHAVLGVWTSPQLHWHINYLELLAVRFSLNHLKGCLRGKHVLVHMINTMTIAYINRQGGRILQLARHLLLWSLKHLRSLCAVHILGLHNHMADDQSQAAS